MTKAESVFGGLPSRTTAARGRGDGEMSFDSLRLRLPATSANLGPGFDALGLAISLSLRIEASRAAKFSIDATGRSSDVTGALESNLMLATYSELLQRVGRPVTPLAIRLENEIPLGMGCGSSAAALCAGVLLANHFGSLHWTGHQVLDEAARLEGHPDNVAACLLGGLTMSKTVRADAGNHRGEHTVSLTVGSDLPWRLLLAIPHASLPTAVARQLLPEVYSRRDAVENVQATALLVAAFAQNRPDLLQTATQDRLHQPYRMAACPLLAALLPLAGRDGVHSVTLSGAGPAVLLVVEDEVATDRIVMAGGELVSEVLEIAIAPGATIQRCTTE